MIKKIREQKYILQEKKNKMLRNVIYYVEGIVKTFFKNTIDKDF